MVTLEMEGDIAFMILHDGSQNKIKCAEFLPLNSLKHWLLEKQPKGLIICGEKRHFSAGADIDYISSEKKDSNEFRETIERGKEILNYIETLPIVTVAAISGICCGGGLEIALSCQFRIAASNSVFSFPECNLGFLPGMGGTVRLPKLIGKKNAIKMILSGENYMTEEALNIGIIDEMVAKGEHINQSVAFINSLCEGRSKEQIKSIITAINYQSQEYETEQFIKYALEKSIVYKG